jgi:menaquinone-dependent protoporphyrinogen oxidase
MEVVAMQPNKVLVAYGTTSGSTAGIAEMIGAALREDGFEVEVLPAGQVGDVAGYDAVVLGGALYANRWHKDARRFTRRHAGSLRRTPVWLFSSGPLDRSATEAEIPPVPSAARAAQRLNALGHVTFGGRLGPEATGWIARKMAQNGRGGDFRDDSRIRAWAHERAAELAAFTARP